MSNIVLAKFPRPLQSFTEGIVSCDIEATGLTSVTRVTLLPHGDPDVSVATPLNLLLYGSNPEGHLGLLAEQDMVQQLIGGHLEFVHSSEVYAASLSSRHQQPKPFIRISGEQIRVEEFWQRWQSLFTEFDCELRQIDHPPVAAPTDPHILVYDTPETLDSSLIDRLQRAVSGSHYPPMRRVQIRFVPLLKFLPAGTS